VRAVKKKELFPRKGRGFFSPRTHHPSIHQSINSIDSKRTPLPSSTRKVQPNNKPTLATIWYRSRRKNPRKTK
jgi:hypothetical protein